MPVQLIAKGFLNAPTNLLHPYFKLACINHLQTNLQALSSLQLSYTGYFCLIMFRSRGCRKTKMQTNIHTNIHTFWKIISGNQVCFHSQPKHAWFKNGCAHLQPVNHDSYTLHRSLIGIRNCFHPSKFHILKP